MKTANSNTQHIGQGPIIAFALVEPFYDVPETNGPEDNENEDLHGEEPLDDPLSREPNEIDEVEDTEPVKESDLDDSETIDPSAPAPDEDDYADLEEDEDDFELDEEETDEEVDPAADELGKRSDYIDQKIGQGTDLRDGTTII